MKNKQTLKILLILCTFLSTENCIAEIDGHVATDSW